MKIGQLRPFTSYQESKKSLWILMFITNAKQPMWNNTRQTDITIAPCDKEAKARAITCFFYRNEIDFNVARTNDFKLILEAIYETLKPISSLQSQYPSRTAEKINPLRQSIFI